MIRQALVSLSRRTLVSSPTTSLLPAMATTTARRAILPSTSLLPSPSRRQYHEKVLDHYNSPRNVGSFDKKDLDVGTGLVGAPACGDVMKLQIKVDDSGKITEARFKTFGCGSAIASSSFITQHVQGMTLEEAEAVKNTEVARELSLPPVKLHCSMLAEDAIKSAIKDYRKKKLQQVKSTTSSSSPSPSTTVASA
ncbi:MAG: iron sulfur cluster assembly protein 1, mitochondrial [Piptocephalis tieghemiana]|nr:MAG: iron sulfur cluster assembly protein 1, mitochondrial [Piptocephalis tieghemiana]